MTAKERKNLAHSLGGRRSDLNPDSTETWWFPVLANADAFSRKLEKAGHACEMLAAGAVLVVPIPQRIRRLSTPTLRDRLARINPYTWERRLLQAELRKREANDPT